MLSKLTKEAREMDKSKRVEEIIEILSEVILNYIAEMKGANDLIQVREVAST